MPKDTFYHLPEEKKRRILAAADSEFRRVPYSDTSINRIVKSARIPRGSFYQYFEDKSDLFFYLLSRKYEDVKKELAALLKEAEGNCFRFIYVLIERFILVCKDARQGEMILFFLDDNLRQLMMKERKENPVFLNMRQDILQYLICEMDFSRIAVDGEQEERYLLDILQSVIADSIKRIVKEEKSEDPSEELDRLSARIHFLEKHYKKEADGEKN